MEYPSSKKWSLRQFFTNSIIKLEYLAQTDVGRSKSSDLCLRCVFLSSRHAAFVINVYGNLLLRDLNSNSGTFVNGKALVKCENKVLAHGDVVSFGLADYVHATSKLMKICFFEVIADDRESTMITSRSAHNLLNTAQPSTSKITERKEELVNPIIITGPSKPLPEDSTSGKNKEHIKIIQHIKISDPISNKDSNELVNPNKELSSNPNDSLSNQGKEIAADPSRTDLSIKIIPNVILNSGLQISGTSFRESSSDSDYTWLDDWFNSVDDRDIENSQRLTSNMPEASIANTFLMDKYEDFYDINKASTSKMAETSKITTYINDRDEDFNDINKPSTSKMDQTSEASIKDFDNVNKPSTSKMAQTSEAIIFATKVNDDNNKPSTSKMDQAGDELVKTDNNENCSSNKPESPLSDESATLLEHQNRCPSGIKRTILRKIPTKRQYVSQFRREETEREYLKAIHRKKLEEKDRQRKAENKVVNVKEAFDALLKAELDKHLNKSDTDDDNDDK